MTDEQTADEILSDARWERELSLERDPTTLRAAIVRALQQAYANGFTNGHTVGINHEANREVLRMCHEARMMNGIVDYSDPNATGVVRRVVTKSIGPIAYPTGDYVHVLRVEASWEEMSKAAESAKEAK